MNISAFEKVSTFEHDAFNLL